MTLFPFRNHSSIPRLPPGFVLETEQAPSPEALNRLLSRCRETTHPPERLSLALQRSVFHLSIFEEGTGSLAGFVRVTSDFGLNANLWNLVAKPGACQAQLIAVLVNRALAMLRRDLPGCSISVSATTATLEALQEQGFLIDPNGIRAMGYRLRRSPGSLWRNIGLPKP